MSDKTVIPMFNLLSGSLPLRCATVCVRDKISASNWGFRRKCFGEREVCHTGRKGLLELGGLFGVLEDKGVEVLLAADLELDVLALGVLLDAGSCTQKRRL